MKTILLSLSLAAFAAAQSASAITISFTQADWVVPSADTITFDSGLPANVAFTGNEGVVTGSLANEYAAPTGDSTPYLSVGANGMAVISFSGGQSELSLLWGSIDYYNKIEFFYQGVALSFVVGDNAAGTIFGDDVISGPNGSQLSDGTLTVTIAGILFDKIVLTNQPGINAFEVDNIKATPVGREALILPPVQVPDGGATLTLLGIALTGLFLGHRRVVGLL